MSRLFALVVLAAVLIGAVAYNVRARQTPEQVQSPPGQLTATAPLAVTTTTVETSSFVEPVTVQGTARSDRQAVITARSPARILSIPVREGMAVTAGQTLVRLDASDSRPQVSGAEASVDAARAQLRKAVDGRRARKTEMDSQVSQAQTGLDNARVKLQQAELAAKLQEASGRSDVERSRAAVLQAEAGVTQAKLALDQAETTLKRVEFLYSKGGVARVEVDGARTQAEIARSQRDGAEAALKQAQAAEMPTAETAPLRDRVSRQDVEVARLGVRQAESALKTAVSARTDALRISDRDVEAAQAAVRQAEAGRLGTASLAATAITSPLTGTVTALTAHPGELAQPGQPLMTVISDADLYVDASVPARFAAAIRPGARASLRLEDGLILSGTVREVLPAVTGDGRSVPVRVIPKQSSVRLSPGVAVTVTITPAAGPRPTVPSEAIHSDGDRNFVWLVDGNRASRREIRTGRSDGGRTEVLSGLSGGERIITSAPPALTEGSPIPER